MAEEVGEEISDDQAQRIMNKVAKNGKDLDYCRYSCGKTIHSKCFSMWERTKGSICVFCRANWYSTSQIKNRKKEYININYN